VAGAAVDSLLVDADRPGILSLQYVSDIYNLVTGREPPFGITAERKA